MTRKRPGNSATKSVSLDVTGKKQLKLVVTDSGNGRDFDHADWANARWVGSASVPQTAAPVFATGKDRKLSDVITTLTI